MAEVRDTLGLSMQQLAQLLGATTLDVEQWTMGGAPESQRVRIEGCLTASRYLSQKLKIAGIPDIVRRPSDRLGGRSMLDVLLEAGPVVLLEHLEALFSYQLR